METIYIYDGTKRKSVLKAIYHTNIKTVKRDLTGEATFDVALVGEENLLIVGDIFYFKKYGIEHIGVLKEVKVENGVTNLTLVCGESCLNYPHSLKKGDKIKISSVGYCAIKYSVDTNLVFEDESIDTVAKLMRYVMRNGSVIFNMGLDENEELYIEIFESEKTLFEIAPEKEANVSNFIVNAKEFDYNAIRIVNESEKTFEEYYIDAVSGGVTNDLNNAQLPIIFTIDSKNEMVTGEEQAEEKFAQQETENEVTFDCLANRMPKQVKYDNLLLGKDFLIYVADYKRTLKTRVSAIESEADKITIKFGFFRARFSEQKRKDNL